MGREDEALRITRGIIQLETEREAIVSKLEEVDSKIAQLRKQFSALFRGPSDVTRRSASPSSVIERIEAIFRAAPDRALDAEAIAAQLNDPNVEMGTIRSTLIRLLHTNRLERVDRGMYRLLSSEPGTEETGSAEEAAE